MSIAIEVAELMELFQWTLENEPLDGEKLAEIRHELADVVIYCLSMANVTKTYLPEAVQENSGKLVLRRSGAVKPSSAEDVRETIREEFRYVRHGTS